jgi:hypothetical protein
MGGIVALAGVMESARRSAVTAKLKASTFIMSSYSELLGLVWFGLVWSGLVVGFMLIYLFE